MSSIDDSESSHSQVSSTRDLKAKILRFQSYEQNFKHFSKQINHALTYPNEYQKEIFDALLQHEEMELNKLFNVYNSLSAADRRPYDRLVNQYEQWVKQHKKLVALLQNEQSYLQLIQQSKQINFDLLAEYKETLTLQYLIRGVMGLLGAFCVHLMIGASARWNMLNAYATSYYKVTSNPYLIISEDSYASPLSLFCMGVGMRTGIRLEKAVGPLYTCIIAMFFSSLAVFISSYMPTFQLYVIFSFALYPFFANLAFHGVISQCFKYYPKQKLFINGVIIVGTGFGHIFFGMINVECLNPEDIPGIGGYYGGDLDYIARRIPNCMRIMGYLVFVLGVIGASLIYPMISYNVTKKAEKKHERKRLDFQHACASEREAFGSKIFWIFMAIVVLSASGLYFLNSNFKNIRAKFEKNTFKLASDLFAFNLANSLSRAFWVLVFPKLGIKFCLVIITSLNIFVLGTLQLIVQDENIYLIYYIIGGICLGGCMVVFLNFSLLVFGQYVGEQLPGYVWTCYSVANLLQYIITNTYNVADVGYLPTFILLAFFNVISLIVIIRTKLQGQWQNSLNLLQLKCYF